MFLLYFYLSLDHITCKVLEYLSIVKHEGCYETFKKLVRNSEY